MPSVGVLISGRGSNLQALIDAAAGGRRWAARVAVVISNVAGAPGLERARGGRHPRPRAATTAGRPREDHDRAMLAALRAHGVDLVCLAGYMRLLSAGVPRRLSRPHPERPPLPAARVSRAWTPQRQAWEHGVKVSGATVHLVDEGLDTGPDRAAGGGAGGGRTTRPETAGRAHPGGRAPDLPARGAPGAGGPLPRSRAAACA